MLREYEKSIEVIRISRCTALFASVNADVAACPPGGSGGGDTIWLLMPSFLLTTNVQQLLNAETPHRARGI